MTATDTPVWQHGFRCHGYWLGNRRIGFVGLPPRIPGGYAKDIGYGWGLDSDESHRADFDRTTRPRMKTLRAAKRAVEEAYRVYLGGDG